MGGDGMSFDDWFYLEPHRKKYSRDHPAYLAAREGYNAGLERAAEIADNINYEITGDMIAFAIRKELTAKSGSISS